MHVINLSKISLCLTSLNNNGKFFLTIRILLFVCIHVGVFAQGTQNLKEYTPDFKFKEGIYLNFDQFKSNSPLPKSRIIAKIDHNDIDYFSKLLAFESVSYFDEFGIQQTIKVYDLWGYCRKGMVFINWQGDFSRIPVIGSICFFAATINVSSNKFADPFDPYGGFGSIETPHEETRQFLIDFETGQVLDFYYTTVEEILKRDEALYSDFKALKKRKKKQMTFLYIRRYNESHPLYFPQ